MTSEKKIDIVIRNILLLFILFAVCGWIYEVIWTYFDDGVWTNRGFLFGPWLPIYGFGGMLIYGIFQSQPNQLFVKNLILAASKRFEEFIDRLCAIILSHGTNDTVPI
jgi:uncharacterized membrane protein